MKDKRDECGCHRDCLYVAHECEHPCIWPSCLTDEEKAELAASILLDPPDR